MTHIMDRITIFYDNLEWDAQHMSDVTASGEKNSPIQLHEAQTRDEAERLIEQGYPINHLTHVTRSTPLLVACKQSRNDVIRLLLELGCDMNLSNIYGDSPLHIVVSTNNEEAFKDLLNKGANPNTSNDVGQTLLHISVGATHTNNLLSRILDSIDNDIINHQDKWGRSALRFASSQKTVDSETVDYDPLVNVELLLSKGADPNLPCHEHLTPLHIATQGQFPSTIKALLEHGASIHVRDKEHGHTALQMASQEDSVEVVRILVEANSDMNTIDIRGNSLLHTAKEKEVLNYLLTTSCVNLINTKNHEGHTPLHIIVHRHDGIDMVESLLNNNADISILNNNGQSCLHTCIGSIFSQRLNIIKKLVHIGVDVLLKDIFDKNAVDYIPERDIESRKYLQGVIDDCKNPGFKRMNTNTNTQIEDEDEDTNDMGFDEEKKT